MSTLMKKKKNLFTPNHIKFSNVQMKEDTKALYKWLARNIK